MPDSDTKVILTRLDSIQSDVTEIKVRLGTLNGTVQQHCTAIAVLKATSLSLDGIKFGGIIGGAVVIVAAIGKVAGLW